jgi:CO/xanthine dehydrogenase FAD-binding subunit
VAAEQALVGQPLNADSVAKAVAALRSELQPLPDLTHSEAAKRQLASVLLKRTLQAWMQAATHTAAA